MSIKKPERIIGYLNIENCDWPFEFDENEFVLSLYPPTKEKWRESSNPIKLLQELENERDSKEWINTIRLEGITSERCNIVFAVLDSSSNYHGFISYHVEWYYYCRESDLFDRIDGFRLTGQAVDAFITPQAALMKKVHYSDDDRVTMLEVSSKEGKIEYPCGSYSVTRGVRAAIEGGIITKLYSNTTSPIETFSFMRFDFSSSVDLSTLLTAVNHVDSFFKYITYRNNASFNRIETYTVMDNEKKKYSGELVFPYVKPENDNQAEKRIIEYPVLKKKVARLLIAIKTGKISFPYFYESIDDMSQYSLARVIMIIAEFEGEFHNIYGIDGNRSKEYIQIKEEIVDLIEKYRREQSGVRKKYVGSIEKTVQKINSGYSSIVEYAINDCKEIMRPFIRKNYNQSVENVIKDISLRVGVLRNRIAHSRLDLQIEPEHVDDIKVIEELTYAIRLKKIGIAEEYIRKGINDLFNERIGHL